MKLLIVESPGKIKTLKKYLGPDWEVAASLGHVRDLPQREIGVEPPTFIPAYELNDKGKTTVPKLKALAAKCDEVYLASDPDREGESIAWHLKEVLRLKTHKRVTFNEITKSAVASAIASPRTIDMALVAAQEARRTLDRLVGYLVSPALSSATGYNGLSAGRVQSPALRLVIEREEAIRAFKAVKHFGVKLTFEGDWTAEWAVKRLLPKDQEHWTDEPFAVEVSKLRKVRVEGFKEGEAFRAPPAPFTTSTLQQAASAALSMDPEDTMRHAQKLYEAGLITYMRTDNPNLSEEALSALSSYAKSAGLPVVEKFRKWKAKDGSQEAHEAIRPANFALEVAGDDRDQQRLYTLIRNRALASQLADAKYATRQALMVGLDTVKGELVHFEAKGRTLLEPGWLVLTKGDQTVENEEAEPSNPIPNLVAGQVLHATKGELLKKETKPLPRFTQAGLVKELEARGIGRPATYAAIMANIKNKGYVEQKQKMLIPTDTGFLVVKSLVGNFQFIEYPFTKNMEDGLDDIAQGKTNYRTVVTSIYDTLQEELKSLKDIVATRPPEHACLDCGKGLRRIKGKTGYFWGCSNYPDCKTTLPDVGGKPGTKEAMAAAEAASPHKCDQCGKSLRRVNGKNGFFWSCTGYPDCRNALPDVRGKPGKKGEQGKTTAKSTTKSSGAGSKASAPAASKYKCTCGKPLIHRVKEGTGGFNFWGCSGYPDCKKSFKDDNGKPKMT